MSGYVYYIGCSETARVKIGYTSGDPIARLKALQTGSASKLTLVAYEPGDMDDERRLHNEYAAQRLNGEWFTMSEDLFKRLCMIVWLSAKHCLAVGEEPEAWVKTGLRMMQDGVADLPPDLAELAL